MDRSEAAPQRPGHQLGVLGLIGLVVGFLALLIIVQAIVAHGLDLKHGDYPNVKTTLRAGVVPECVGLAYVLAAIAWLGWWPAVWREPKSIPPLPRWVWAIPATMLLCAVIVIAYGKLGDFSIGFWVLLAFFALLVGTAEELLFRGVSVQTFRARGFSEPKVALWTSVIFGCAHLANLIASLITGRGASPIQALVTAVLGYFLYLSRRVSGTLLLPIIVHASWDFSLFSQGAGHSPATHPIVALSFLTVVALAILTARGKPVRTADTAAAPETAPATSSLHEPSRTTRGGGG